MHSNRQTVIFVVILCCVCALILAVLATVLKGPQERAVQLDRAQQMLEAAQIKAPTAEALDVWHKRITPMLVTPSGDLVTFEKAGINYDDYLADHQQKGYATLRYKLIYTIDTGGVIIPINGYGLWGPIYGYLALKGTTVIGASWYAPQETPGLGAVIQSRKWLAQFPGRQIIPPGSNLKTGPLGIIVVKGKVSDVLDDSPASKTAVDGVTGATLTGNGVMAAYKKTLTAYRPFFLRQKA